MANTSVIKVRLIEKAWDLFKEKGYDDTTVDDIATAAGASKGAFYYYFAGKDEMLETLTEMIDMKYDSLKGEMSPDMDSYEKLNYMSEQVLHHIEDIASPDLVGALYAAQLVNKGARNLLIDRNRMYYRLSIDVIHEGQIRGEISKEYSAKYIMWYYAMVEHGIIYDWAINGGEYSLGERAAECMPYLMKRFRGERK